MGNRILYEEETGEVGAIIGPWDSVKITSAETKANFKKLQEEKKKSEQEDRFLNEGQPFVKIYSNTLFHLSMSLTGPESQFINYLIQYIRYGSGILARTENNGGSKTLTRREMSVETGLSERMVDKLLKGLVEKQVIGKHKTGQDISFTVNPFIFMKGNRVNETLFTFFRNSRWAKEIKK